MSKFLPTRLLDSRLEARFETSFTLEEARTRLNAIVSESSLGSLFQEHIRGNVSDDSVYLERATPFFHNSWRPTFSGKWTTDGGRLALVGSFGLNRGTRYFMWFFVGFGILWSVGAGCSVLTQPQPVLPMWFPFVGLGMSCLGVLMAKGFAATSKEDVEWLSGRIRDVLERTREK